MLTSRLSVSKNSLVRNFCATSTVPKRRKANRPIVVQQRARNKDLDILAETSNMDWRLMGAT